MDVSKIAIVTDSTATIPEQFVEEFEIHVAPQVVIFGEESLRDGVDITASEFYERLRASAEPPTTSQVTVATFQSIFEPLVDQDLPILAILISAKLSGTIRSAEQAKGMFPGAQIEIIDSYSAAMGLGFQVLAAARAIKQGKSLDEVSALAREARSKVGVFFFVDTLEYLHRGGRIGGASRFLGTALNIKPLLELRDGGIEPLERVRTKSKALSRLLQIFEKQVSGQAVLRLASLHAAAEEDAEALLRDARSKCDPIETLVAPVTPAIGAHTGPGTLGLIYFAGH